MSNLSRTLRTTVAALAFLCAAAHAFDLQGHRGARGLAPENSLPAFERALEVGVSTLELDVNLSADGVLVVGHDPLLNPMVVRDAQGQWLAPGTRLPVKSLTWEQLQSYDVGRIQPGSNYAKTFSGQQPRDGTRMPRLEQVFALVRERGADHVRFNIETKLNPDEPDSTATPETLTRALLQAVRDAGLVQRVSIQSFDWRSLQLVQQLEPGIPTVYLTIQTPRSDNVRDGAWTAGLKLADHGGSVPRLVKAAGGAVWSPNGGALKPEMVREAQALGLKVIPWTINTVADMERLVGWGVDGLITDYPDRLRAVLQARGLALPPVVPAR